MDGQPDGSDSGQIFGEGLIAGVVQQLALSEPHAALVLAGRCRWRSCARPFSCLELIA